MGKMGEIHRKLSEGEPLTAVEIAVTKVEPYEVGWAAYLRGVAWNRNPYSHSAMAGEWRLGWEDACAYYDEEDGRD